MSIEQNLSEENIFQSMSNTILVIGIDKGFAFKNFVISCLASIFDLGNPKMKIH